MKRKIALLALLAVFAAIAASGTIAYFTSETHAHNVITSGGVGVEIVEKDEHGKPFQNLNGIMPGTSEYKIVTVNNVESGDAWIRAKLDVVIHAKQDADFPMPNVLPNTIGNDNEINVVEFMVEVDGDNGKELVKLSDLATEDNENFNWVYKDGYYYFENIVPAVDEDGNQSATDVLFHKVYFAPEMDNAYQNCTVYINVEAEAVQSAHNPEPAEGVKPDVLAAQGWPEPQN